MPERLKTFLKTRLSKDEAESLWDWLDSNPQAIEDLIEVLARRGDLTNAEVSSR